MRRTGTGEDIFGQSNLSKSPPPNDIEKLVIFEAILFPLKSFDDGLLFADFLCDLELMDF